MRAVLVDVENKGPDTGQVFFVERFGHKLADLQEVVIQIARPEDRQLLHPTVLLPQPRNQHFRIGQGLYGERRALEVKFHRVLISVDIVAVHSKPLSVERRKTHQPKGVVKRAVKTAFHKVPRQRSDGIGKTFG